MKICTDFEELIPIHAVEEAAVEEALAVEEHVAACAACARDLAFYREIRDTVRRELAEVPPVPAFGRLRGVAAWRIAARWTPRLAAAAAILAAGLLIGRWTAAPAQVPAGLRATYASAVAQAGGPLRDPASLALSVFSPHAKRFLARAAEEEKK